MFPRTWYHCFYSKRKVTFIHELPRRQVKKISYGAGIGSNTLCAAATLIGEGADTTGGGVDDGGGGPLRLTGLFVFGGAPPFGPADGSFVQTLGGCGFPTEVTAGAQTATAVA